MEVNVSNGSCSHGLPSCQERNLGHGTLSTSSSSSCHLCGYESVRHSNVIRHLKTMHEGTAQVLQCCEMTFQDKAEYRDHCRQSHRNGHECRICRRRFTRRALLRRHQSVHTGFKEFSCPSCSYASSHKSNLERHFKTHSDLSLRKTRARRYAPPDSTTEPALTLPIPSAATTPHSYPILRHMLKPHTLQNVAKTPKLSHSIESILNRKEEVPGDSSLIKSQLPSIPDINKVNYDDPGYLSHSLSSPFNWTSPQPFQVSQYLRNQGSWPYSSQDLRIYSKPHDPVFTQGPPPWWHPLFVTPNLYLTNGNYSYPYYASSTMERQDPHCQVGTVGDPLFNQSNFENEKNNVKVEEHLLN